MRECSVQWEGAEVRWWYLTKICLTLSKQFPTILYSIPCGTLSVCCDKNVSSIYCGTIVWFHKIASNIMYYGQEWCSLQKNDILNRCAVVQYQVWYCVSSMILCIKYDIARCVSWDCILGGFSICPPDISTTSIFNYPHYTFNYHHNCYNKSLHPIQSSLEYQKSLKMLVTFKLNF